MSGTVENSSGVTVNGVSADVSGNTFEATLKQHRGSSNTGKPFASSIRFVTAQQFDPRLSWDDVAMNTDTPAYRLRREMESLFS